MQPQNPSFHKKTSCSPVVSGMNPRDWLVKSIVQSQKFRNTIRGAVRPSVQGMNAGSRLISRTMQPLRVRVPQIRHQPPTIISEPPVFVIIQILPIYRFFSILADFSTKFQKFRLEWKKEYRPYLVRGHLGVVANDNFFE